MSSLLFWTVFLLTLLLYLILCKANYTFCTSAHKMQPARKWRCLGVPCAAKSLLVVWAQGTTEKSQAMWSLQPPLRHLQTLMRSPWASASSPAEQPQLSQPLLIWEVFVIMNRNPFQHEYIQTHWNPLSVKCYLLHRGRQHYVSF